MSKKNDTRDFEFVRLMARGLHTPQLISLIRSLAADAVNGGVDFKMNIGGLDARERLRIYSQELDSRSVTSSNTTTEEKL